MGAAGSVAADVGGEGLPAPDEEGAWTAERWGAPRSVAL